MIRLFHFHASPTGIAAVEMSYDLDYPNGIQQLCYMLQLDAKELGFFPEPIPMPGHANVGLLPERFLGRGAHATAYAAPVDGDHRTIVIKLFRHDSGQAFATEIRVLQSLNEANIEGITRLLGSAAYPPTLVVPNVLLLEPEGVTLERALEPQLVPQRRLTRE